MREVVWVRVRDGSGVRGVVWGEGEGWVGGEGEGRGVGGGGGKGRGVMEVV